MILRRFAALFWMGIIFSVGSAFYMPEQPDVQEYALKAAFVYRFTDYVEWASNNSGQNFTIAVLGESGITAPLNDIAKNKKVNSKSIFVKECSDINNIGDCQVLFISHTYRGAIKDVISKVDNSVLIVTEEKGACEQGSHINFVVQDNKLKFEINLNAATKANLKISSQLLQHAILINTP